ncbi:SDR family oxidoreductase [Nocardia suismassiliense]|uniref:SDR family oxidoreductase n=1 Tax=Nocardia suismassiliense TaxID=2077092 RepID=UPI000D1EA431|nr:SDR family oxidoreductase [Nocardia suismassiliense]
MTGRLDGKVALITAAAGRVGREQALRFAQEGADIVAIDPSAQDLAETVRLVAAMNRRSCAFEADVRDQQTLNSAVSAGVEALGRLDILCATDAFGSPGPALDVDPEDWPTLLDVNLTGVWRICKAGIPHLLEGGRGGSIVLMSSTAGLRGVPLAGPAATAEHGVVGLMKSLANELAQHSVRVNTVHPTPHHAGRELHLLPVAAIEPVDIANASLFLASDEARYITGVTLPVDAGHCVK